MSNAPQSGFSNAVPQPGKRSMPLVLVVIIVVVAIVLVCGGGAALVAAVTMPALSKARQSAQMISAASNLRAIGAALLAYSADNNGWMPEAEEGWEARLMPYLPQSPPPGSPGSIFETPWAQEARATADGSVQTPAYVYLPPGDTNAFASITSIVLAHENPALASTGQNISVLFLDGRVESVAPEALVPIVARSTDIVKRAAAGPLARPPRSDPRNEKGPSQPGTGGELPASGEPPPK